jgi:predicted dehydrogenase
MRRECHLARRRSQQCPKIDLVAGFDIHEAAVRGFADRHGVASVGSIGEMANACDAVVVAAPPTRHREATATALGFGLHVLLEKPARNHFQRRVASSRRRGEEVGY